jgi:hypothetical protein
LRARQTIAAVVSACVALAVLLAVAIGSDGVPVIGDAGGSDSAAGDSSVLVAGGSGDGADSGGGGEQGPDGGSSLVWISADERVDRGEALPCTGPNDPTNFEVYSAGPAVGGLPLTGFKRRCGAATPVDEPPANFTNYIYGDCEPGASGSCVPPLEIQTWPACERSLADYSFGGKPMPYRRLPSDSRADVVEIQFEFEPRVEVYSKASTIVIFAEDLALAEKAVAQLTSQKIGNPPATKAGELKGKPDGDLAPPSDGATEGELSC